MQDSNIETGIADADINLHEVERSAVSPSKISPPFF